MPASVEETQALYDEAEETEKKLQEKVKVKRLKFFKENKKFADYFSNVYQYVLIKKNTSDFALLGIAKAQHVMAANALGWFRKTVRDVEAELSVKQGFEEPIKRFKQEVSGFEKLFGSLNENLYGRSELVVGDKLFPEKIGFEELVALKRETGFVLPDLPLRRRELVNSMSSISEVYTAWFDGTAVGRGLTKKAAPESFESLELT